MRYDSKLIRYAFYKVESGASVFEAIKGKLDERTVKAETLARLGI